MHVFNALFMHFRRFGTQEGILIRPCHSFLRGAGRRLYRITIRLLSTSRPHWDEHIFPKVRLRGSCPAAVRQSIKKVVRDSIGRQRGKLESLGGEAPPLQQAGARGIAGGAGRAPQGEELQATRVGTGLSLDALSVSVFARMHYLVKQL